MVREEKVVFFSFSFHIVLKGGGGSTGIQKVWCSLFFSFSRRSFVHLMEEGGWALIMFQKIVGTWRHLEASPKPKILRHNLPKY